ncbi:MAG TPA: FAD-dependent oxidoreductase [Bryobacteraceae bacterium]
MSRASLFFLTVFLAAQAAGKSFDVVVYGGTAGGVIASVAAAREGLHVALVEPTSHLGGMVSGGLSFTDVGKREVIGGDALEFYVRVARRYQLYRYGQSIGWYHEPHVGEEIFDEMLREAHVEVFENHALKERGGIAREGTHATRVATENGDVFTARIFIDSSYEGDLMAQVGVSFTVGRESSEQYGEVLAGVRSRTPFHQFLVDIPARTAEGKLLPEIDPNPPGAPGSADKKVQSYNFRSCFSDDSANQTPFAKPKHYDPARYRLLAMLLAARAKQERQIPRLKTLLSIDAIPNHKADINNNGAFSTDYIGGSWQYPNANYHERARIRESHREYQQGLYYFLANDDQVPAPVREEMRQWGLCKDEFADNGNWPYQIYIREARRMIGEYVMTQKDLQDDLTKPDAIGMGSYNSDSHNVERIVDPSGFVRNEGDMQVPVKPYQIPYRVMLPKRNEVTNLLVPVAFSASHVAYSSVRMEPQYMILGQAAGEAAKLAIEAGKAVQEIDTKRLTARLEELGAVLEYSPSAQARALSVVEKQVRR